MEGWSKVVGRALQTEVYIDPGTKESGIVWKQYNVMGEPSIYRLGNLENEAVLNACGQVTTVCIEELSGMGQMIGQSTLDTAVWVGRFIERTIATNKQLELMTRRDVKLYLCGQCRAKDKDIRNRVVSVLGEVPTKKHPNPNWPAKPSNHVWQAAGLMLAIGMRREEKEFASRVREKNL